MVTSLQSDCIRLNERQDRILHLFGRLVQAKYEINRGGEHSTELNHIATPGSRRTGKKEEVYYDAKWKPLVEAHERLLAVRGGNASLSSSSSPSTHITNTNNKTLLSSPLSFFINPTAASTGTDTYESKGSSLSVLSKISPTLNQNYVPDETEVLLNFLPPIHIIHSNNLFYGFLFDLPKKYINFIFSHA